MPDWTQVRRPHVVAAVEEYDRLGSKEFLVRYGFRKARAYLLWHQGNEYDSKAILGAAYFHATGHAATWDEFSGGEHGAAKVLTDLGFDVVAKEQPVSSVRSRPTSPSKKRTTSPEPVLRTCPRCHVVVPSTGVCDFCD